MPDESTAALSRNLLLLHQVRPIMCVSAHEVAPEAPGLTTRGAAANTLLGMTPKKPAPNKVKVVAVLAPLAGSLRPPVAK